MPRRRRGGAPRDGASAWRHEEVPAHLYTGGRPQIPLILGAGIEEVGCWVGKGECPGMDWAW